MNYTSSQSEKIAMKVSKTSIVVNIFLTLLKLFAGIFAHSEAMISDAVHSASDVFSTIIVVIGVKISRKDADKEHPYGHERMECVASLVLTFVLLMTGIEIGKRSFSVLISGTYQQLVVPGVLALISACISIAVKEWMYQYTKNSAKKIHSSVLLADAWHHRSDALSSIGALVGILGSRMGFPIMDHVASCIICIFIFKACYDIFKDAVDKMVDKSCDDEIADHIRQEVSSQVGVLEIDQMLTREFGDRIYVDLEISVDGSLTLQEAHGIAHAVHDNIEKKFPDVKHIMVHVNPYIHHS